MLHISSKLTALITTIAVAAPVSAAEAASSRHTVYKRYHAASTQRHFRAAASHQSASSTARFDRCTRSWS